MKTGCIASNEVFNVNYDIVWSFKFLLSGATINDQGGFVTFLKTPGPLSGGAVGQFLGYGGSSIEDYYISTENCVDLFTEGDTLTAVDPNDPLNIIEYQGNFDEIEVESFNQLIGPGLSGAFLGIAFDTTGMFALSYGQGDLGCGASITGVSESELYKNALIIRSGEPDFTLLYNIPLSSISTQFKLLTTTETYCWLRFRLGDVCSMLYIDYRYDDDSQYTQLTSLPLETLVFNEITYTNVGISYSSPVCSTAIQSPAIFRIQNFHVEGTNRMPDYTSFDYISSISTILLTESGNGTNNVATQDEHIILT